jgi:hypothetical protein
MLTGGWWRCNASTRATRATKSLPPLPLGLTEAGAHAVPSQRPPQCHSVPQYPCMHCCSELHKLQHCSAPAQESHTSIALHSLMERYCLAAAQGPPPETGCCGPTVPAMPAMPANPALPAAVTLLGHSTSSANPIQCSCQPPQRASPPCSVPSSPRHRVSDAHMHSLEPERPT